MKKTMRSRNVFLIRPVVSALAMAFGTMAFAEEPIASLPEVKVEAKKESGYKVDKSANQKFTAPLIDTPKSITIITEGVIRDSGSNSFQDALRTAPGITFGTGEGGGPIGDRPFIRGFDAQSAIFVDGMRDLGSQQREVFAIEQLEVLKGPSGAFDGRGSAGGSINIVTKKAKADNFTTGSVGIGTDNYRRATVDANYMLGDNAALRLVAMAHDADIPGRDSVDTRRWGFAPSITLGLNSPTSATLSWYHLESDDMPDRGLPYRDNSGNAKSQPVSVSKDNFYGLNKRDYQETQADIGTFELKHAFTDDVVLRNTIRYGETSNEYIVTRTLPSIANQLANIAPRTGQGRKAETTSVANLTDISVKFNTGDIKHNVNTGVEFSHEETDQFAATIVQGTNPNANFQNPNPNDPYNGSTSFSSRPTATTTSKTTSAYVFDSIELNKEWLVNGGVRYDKFRVKNNAASADHGFFNYQAGVVYKVQPNASIYASYGTSSTPVGLSNGDGNQENGNNLSATSEDLKPERTKSFEVGTKWDVFEGLSLTAAAFYTNKSDARVLLVDGNFANAGEFNVKGVEFGAAGKITDKWDVFAGYTHLNSEQSKVGTALLSPTAHRDLGGAQNKGNDMPGVAKNSASIWTTYKVLPKLTVGGGAFYVDKVFADPGNMLFVPSYVRYDAMASYVIDPRFSLQLNIQNLTDKRYFNQTYTRHFATVAPGRLSFLTLNMKF